MPSRAKSCAILNTKLLVTSAGASKSEVHHTILLALTNALNQSKFIESIPNLTTTSYLGPDPESMTLPSASPATGMRMAGGTTTASVIAISIGCSLLLLISALCLIFRRTSKAVIAEHSWRFSRQRHKLISTHEVEEGSDENLKD
jgi:hypothetical protein